jgi:beta-N-acetylhexosaminidase
MVCVGFDGTAVSDDLRRLMARGVRSVILFSRNFQSREQLAALTAEIKDTGRPSAAAAPTLICTDHEGGRVQRFRDGFSAIPPLRGLGRTHSPADIRALGQAVAVELRGVNIDMNLAPVLDVDSNPANPVIGPRSFGSDPKLVAALGAAMIDGLQSAGVAACGKHFPGHGDTTIDSHLDLPRLFHDRPRLAQVELRPFIAAIRAGVAAIMIAHIVFDAIDASAPATMSRTVVTGLLREELGFAGVVISDDLEMKAIIDHFGIEEAVTRGAAAGVDLFLACHTPDLQHRAIDAIVHGVERGFISRHQVEDANARLDRLFNRFVQPSVAHRPRA